MFLCAECLSICLSVCLFFSFFFEGGDVCLDYSRTNIQIFIKEFCG